MDSFFSIYSPPKNESSMKKITFKSKIEDKEQQVNEASE